MHAPAGSPASIDAIVEFVGAGGAKVFQEHVAMAHELAEQLEALRFGEVEGQGFLAAVAGEEVGA